MLFHIDNFENCLLLQLPINFYTVDARITEPMHTDVGNIFEFFLRLPVLK